jgi:C1A family cysteine protease
VINITILARAVSGLFFFKVWEPEMLVLDFYGGTVKAGKILLPSNKRRNVMTISFLSRSRCWLIMLLAFSCIFLFQSFSYAGANELENIRKAIKGKKAHWVAGETSVSQLSPDAKKKRVGTLKPVLTEEEEEATAEEQAALATLTAPAIYDWRQTEGTNAGNYVTPVRNQGSCGSCWAFATTAALESQVLLSNNGSASTLNLSEQLLVSCGNAGNCGGGYIGTASNYIRDLGLPVETCFPYTATNNTCSSACADWTNNTYQIPGWHYVATGSPTVEVLKNALYTYGPLVTTMGVYSDFYYYKNGVYSYTSGTFQGGHAILIVGYDDAAQCFIVKNSWGTGWGEAGFFRIAYSELNNVVSFGHYSIAYEGSNPVDPVDPPAPAPCTYSISPSGQTFKAAGGSGSITVSTQNACAWNVVSNATWITVNSGASRVNSDAVSYTVDPSASKATRTGTITIGGQAFTVTQQGVKRGRK